MKFRTFGWIPIYGLLALSATTSHAHFLDDYFDRVTEQSNWTRASIYQGQSVRVATGGNFVTKFDRKTLTPISLEAPSLKAGCGGIDIFLGSFSLPSRDEFVSFLRSIGTNLAGLSFQLALQSLSPDLNEQVTSFRDLIMKYSQNYADSCQASEAILQNVGASGYFKELNFLAKNEIRASGEVSDASEADAALRTNGARTIASVPKRTDSAGNVVQNGQINLTWSLLKAGQSGQWDDETLETMMTMLGTVIYTQSGQGDDATISDEEWAARDVLYDLYGPIGQSTLTDAKRYACDEATSCLHPTLVSDQPVNLTHKIYEAAKHYEQSLLLHNRSEVTDSERMLLASVSTLPLLELIEASANPKMPELSDSLLRLYSQVAAYEAITQALKNFAQQIRQTLQTSTAQGVSQRQLAYAQRLEARLNTLLEELSAQSEQLNEAMRRAQTYRTTVAEIERAIYGRQAIETMRALPNTPIGEHMGL